MGICRRHTTIDRKLKQDHIEVAAIEQADKAMMLNEFHPVKNKKLAVVFGNEVKGVRQEVVSASDYCIEIPQFGTKHSLNISVSCGVCTMGPIHQNFSLKFKNLIFKHQI